MENKFEEFEQHLLNDEKPSIYFRRFTNSKLFLETYPFTMLGALKNIEQSPTHHPEGNVWEHTLLVVDLAAEGRHLSDDPRVFMWSALLHDLGKAHTTKVRKGRITAYDHDKYGALLAAGFLKEFTNDEKFIKKVAHMVRWHMQALFVTKKLPFADIDTMVTEVSLGEIALLSLCDRLGRGNITEKIRQDEMEKINYFVQECQQHQDNFTTPESFVCNTFSTSKLGVIETYYPKNQNLD